jgi:PAS domain S-box-containing protein
MSPLEPAYFADPTVLAYAAAAFLTAGLGAGTYLFERFSVSSLRFFLLTVVVACWMVALGLSRGAVTADAIGFWQRTAYLFVPLTVPAVYWMAESLSADSAPLHRTLWAVGAAFALVNLSTPWLVDGLKSLFETTRPLSAASGLGAAYLTFEVTAIGLTARQLALSRRGALSGAEQREVTLLMAAALVAAVSMLDYLLPTARFRAGVLTPVMLPTGAALVTAAAIRYRVFAQGAAFATDEVLRTMSDAVLVCDGLARVRGSNRSAQRLLGRSESQLLGAPVGRLVGWGQGDEWWEWSPSEESRTDELDLRTAEGELVRVSASAEPIQFGGRKVGTVVVARDIRDRLETEQALRASERRYRSLFWHNPAILYEIDLDGRFVAVNPAAVDLLGVAADELRGRPFVEVITEDSRAVAVEVFEAVQRGSPREYELSLRRGEGTERRIRGVSIPIFDQGGVSGVFGVALDQTEASRVKQELEIQRRYFADLFDGSPEGLVLIEADTDRVRRVNQEFTRLFGYTAEEAVGGELSDLIVPEFLRWEGSRLNEAARDGSVVRTETVRRRKDGTLVEVSVLARSLRIPGESAQLYGVYRDISERKKTERALRDREDELRHAQKLEAVGKLAGGIAHDFNNLLTVINGHARFVLEELEPGAALEKDLLEIERAGQRAASLTQQLLAYSRRQVLHPQLLDPNTVVLELQGMLRRLIGEHIRVETRLADEDLRVRADRGQLEQVLTNLVVNARDAMETGGTLTIETGLLELGEGDERTDRWEVEPGEYVRLQVADTGHGMDEATLDRAFEPFFTTKEQGKGTGLGLATVFGIVKQSGGHVTARSEPEEGTAVDVILPRAEAAPVAPVRGRVEHEIQEPEVDGATVLVVEDEAAVRKLAVRVLERAGYTVLSAENGRKALDVLDDHPGLDLILSDLVMPDMGGRELARRLRTARPELPVLFMSGYDEDQIQDAEGADFLAKPFTPAVLTGRVAAALADDAPKNTAERGALDLSGTG